MIPELSGAALLILKIFFLVGLVLYGIFAAVLVRQEQLMGHVLEEGFEPFIRLLVVGHLIGAVGIFLLALFVL